MNSMLSLEYEPFRRDDVEIKEYLTFKDRLKNFMLFVWNPQTKEFCGRDGASWAKISLFYFCFYLALACLFALMLAIFMAIIDKRIPPYSNESSVMARQAVNGHIVGVNPGLGFRPQKHDYSTLLRIKSSERNPKHPYNYQQYVDYLDFFLSYYEVVDKRGEQIIDCGPTSSQEILEKQFASNKVCRFEIVEMLGPGNMCIKSRNYEFDKSKPCILLKLNKIYNWKPEAYEPSDILPAELRPYESIVRKYPRNVFVLCDGENQVDKDFIGHLRYFSRTEDGSGESKLGFIPFYYFPFKSQDGYRSPLVFAYFHNITTNVLVNVMCRAYAKNIFANDLYRIGSVHFEIMIE
jgi:sodium/potassium-transporting ATPase subunit beta